MPAAGWARPARGASPAGRSLPRKHGAALARHVHKTMPVAQRVLGESHELTLTMKGQYAQRLYMDDGATLDDVREAVETLESVAKSWTRVFGKSHPETSRIQIALATARAALRAC